MSNLENGGYEALNKAIASAKMERVIKDDLYNTLCDEFETRINQFIQDTATTLVKEVRENLTSKH